MKPTRRTSPITAIEALGLRPVHFVVLTGPYKGAGRKTARALRATGAGCCGRMVHPSRITGMIWSRRHRRSPKPVQNSPRSATAGDQPPAVEPVRWGKKNRTPGRANEAGGIGEPVAWTALLKPQEPSTRRSGNAVNFRWDRPKTCKHFSRSRDRLLLWMRAIQPGFRPARADSKATNSEESGSKLDLQPKRHSGSPRKEAG
ncbi:MAG: hypothetical protein JWM91_4276 [Rhodospirillales bacterium]|nr:hypothetical protein [Rhodospirillales bacterium]